MIFLVFVLLAIVGFAVLVPFIALLFTGSTSAPPPPPPPLLPPARTRNKPSTNKYGELE